jgi:hypothetical protein
VITYVDITMREVISLPGGENLYGRAAERLFYERAGWAAVPVRDEGRLWRPCPFGFRAYADIPSPEGMLL